MRQPALKLLLAGLAIAGFLGTAPAFANDTPPTLTGAKLVTADEAKSAQAAGGVVVDTRVAAEFAEGHIKGAISVPYREKSAKSVDFDAGQDEFNLAKLPADKAAAIITYCNGPACWKSYKASVAALKAGYTNVLWLREGYPAWQAKKYPTEE